VQKLILKALYNIEATPNDQTTKPPNHQTISRLIFGISLAFHYLCHLKSKNVKKRYV